MEQGVKVGLALGSGSARGFAHIGIIQTLEAEGIPIDCVAGTSIGAIVGAMYAGGNFQECLDVLEKFDWKKVMFLVDLMFPVSGLLEGKQVEKLLNSLLQDQQIEHFPLPFAAVATDVATGEELILDRGNAVKAVRASMSLPGIFIPVYHQDRFLVDGGMVSPVPVSAARQLGADIVIGVNLAAEMSSRSYIPTVKDTAERLQAVELARDNEKEKSLFEHLLRSKYLDVELPEFLKGPITKSRSFFEEQTQALEQWIDEKVEQGRSVLGEKKLFFEEWFSKGKKTPDAPDIFSILFNSINIMQYHIAQASLRHYPADVLLSPDLGTVRLLDFDEADACIEEGKRVAQAALPQIRRVIQAQHTEHNHEA